MFLIPPEKLHGIINSYYETYRHKSTLLGYFPCQNTGDIYCSYFSVEAGIHRVVPVFYVPDMKFDSEHEYAAPGPALFFHGCDDGHLGVKFEEEWQAHKWLEECPYVDFNQLYIAYTQGKVELQYHN